MDRRNSIRILVGSTLGLTIPCGNLLAFGHSNVAYGTPIGKMLQKVNPKNILKDNDWYIWGGSTTKGQDGLYYILYARWPKSATFLGWLTHSEIAVAVAKEPYGPFVHEKIALPARGKEFWDGSCTHNPHINKFGDTYYLYYMGNTGDEKITKSYNFSHRNNQRIGVATAEHPLGPWKRKMLPLIDASLNKKSPDSLCVNNPSVTRMADGKFLMIYKAVGSKKKLPFGGPVVHMAAIADHPEGPFIKQPNLIFTSSTDDFPAEDPFIWYDGYKYRAIAKDMHGTFSGINGAALVEFTSKNGFDWFPLKECLVTIPQIHWTGEPKASLVQRLERPQLYIEDGVPKVLYVSVLDKNGSSYNVPIPLK